ncbi:cytochrome P450 4g15 [Zerene cesonia]|uniref:cytochrome P450 4g15 n=1 Tax=Zerene cesonia TaxID=33412 RepID=UPI0018E59996|nr:cytochrome P450 4g15 [Zerene cesonia]
MSYAAAETVAQSSTWAATNLFYVLLVPALILWYTYWRMSRRNLYELAEKITGPKGLPLIGNALEFTGGSAEIFQTMIKRSEEFDDSVIKVWIGPRLLVFLYDPRDVELILSSHVHIDKADEYKFFKPWLGNGLLISTGQKWRSHRKLIAPTFHLNVLKSFIDLFNANSRAVVEKLKKETGEFDCHDYMSECTVEILLETAMGVSKSTQDRSGFEYAMAVMKMCDILHLRHTKIWLRPDFLFNFTQYAKLQNKLLDIIHGLTKKVIKKKKEEFKSGKKPSAVVTEVVEKETEPAKTTSVEGLSFGQSSGLKDDLDVDDDVGQKKRLAFLDLLLESAQGGVVISDEEIKEQVDTIMFEGHDTTAAGSSFFLSAMGIHQDIQDKVVEELDSIFGDSDRPATFQDTLEMKYLERCLMETLRMFPPVPIIARHLKQDITMPSNGKKVPAGSTVIIATYKLHRREDIYPNPDKFNPDNFLPERSANRHYYAFVPFSAGPRSCVGRKYAMLKLKIILSTILRNFRVYSDLKESDFKLQADIILKRAEGFKVRLEPRKRMTKAC